MQIIETQQEFDEACKRLASAPVIYMDTEFYRRRTYFAKLCVVQIASATDRIIVDVISGIKLDGLKELFSNKEVVKVFHAAEQDFEIFAQLFGELPKNVFDTQIAAGVIGMDPVMGYGRLCKTMLYINLDKTMQKADWLARPLTKALLEYAIKDVEYLIPLHREISKEIENRKLWDTYHSRSKKLLDIKSYTPDPMRIIRKMNLQDRSAKFKEKLKHFVMFREECARSLDIPRGHCASDLELLKIADNLPVSDSSLYKLHIAGQPIVNNKFKAKLFELCLGLREF